MSGDEGWKGQQRDGSSVPVQWSPSSQEISVISEDHIAIYFVAPGTASDSVIRLDINGFICTSVYTKYLLALKSPRYGEILCKVIYQSRKRFISLLLLSFFINQLTNALNVPVEKFLGNQVLSYGQNLTLNFRVNRQDIRLSSEDVVLEGAGLHTAVPLITQGNSYPRDQMQTYVFR